MKNKTFLTALGFLAVGGCSNETSAPEQGSGLQNPTPEGMIDKLLIDGGYSNETPALSEDGDLQNLTQEQLINKLLAELAKKPAPDELKFGAMCYTLGLSRNESNTFVRIAVLKQSMVSTGEGKTFTFKKFWNPPAVL